MKIPLSLSQYMLQCLWKLFSLKSEHIPPISIFTLINHHLSLKLRLLRYREFNHLPLFNTPSICGPRLSHNK